MYRTESGAIMLRAGGYPVVESSMVETAKWYLAWMRWREAREVEGKGESNERDEQDESSREHKVLVVDGSGENYENMLRRQ